MIRLAGFLQMLCRATFAIMLMWVIHDPSMMDTNPARIAITVTMAWCAAFGLDGQFENWRNR